MVDLPVEGAGKYVSSFTLLSCLKSCIDLTVDFFVGNFLCLMWYTCANVIDVFMPYFECLHPSNPLFLTHRKTFVYTSYL